jgi:hypothetical protein
VVAVYKEKRAMGMANKEVWQQINAALGQTWAKSKLLQAVKAANVWAEGLFAQNQSFVYLRHLTSNSCPQTNGALRARPPTIHWTWSSAGRQATRNQREARRKLVLTVTHLGRPGHGLEVVVVILGTGGPQASPRAGAEGGVVGLAGARPGLAGLPQVKRLLLGEPPARARASVEGGLGWWGLLLPAVFGLIEEPGTTRSWLPSWEGQSKHSQRSSPLRLHALEARLSEFLSHICTALQLATGNVGGTCFMRLRA